MKPGTRQEIQGAITRIYGVADDGQPPRWEQLDWHLPERKLAAILESLGQTPLAEIEMDSLGDEGSLAHHLYVSLEGRPSWLAFNREMTEGQRRKAACDQPLVYWTILVSRVGPLWTGYWNEFTATDRMIPEVVAEPSTWEWSSVTNQIRHVLARAGFVELSQADLAGLGDRKPYGMRAGISTYELIFGIP